MSKYVVAALYKFAELANYQELREPLLKLMEENEVYGTLLLAKEGINGTISGSRQGIDAVYAWLTSFPALKGLSYKESYHDALPFKRTKVKLKKEIVTLGVEGLSPLKTVGTYVKPQDWNKLISDPEVVLVDTRNNYEIEIGTFKRAVNPKTETFREFPQYVKQNLNPKKHKKVAMYCTGGIRCEKSTAYLKEQGFEEVYHLEGGILKYLEEVPQEESLWQGDCFVFDERVAVNHGLQKGKYSQCFACRYPITEEDKQSEFYQKGISCPRCYAKMSVEQKARFAERQKQSALAKTRGEAHLGKSVKEIITKRRELKKAQKKSQAEQR